MIKHHEVVIMGGGLAGLTLALQLKKKCASLDICVIEKNKFPVPSSAHKVGEATVELSSYYLAKIVGIEDHLDNHQLPKLGLRYFFSPPGTKTTSLEESLEFGTKSFPPTPSYQLDRGILENHLHQRCLDQGVHVLSQTKVKNVEIAERTEPHAITVQDILTKKSLYITAKWLVDASSRSSIIKRKLNLKEKVDHHASSAWFRISKEINVDSWHQSRDWTMHHDKENSRWFSTNHLMGEGYWMWIIPLASGSTSIGIVAEDSFHPLSSYNTPEKALSWIEQHQPLCYEKIKDLKDNFQDFRAVKDFTLHSSQVFSTNRWYLTGEAGVFLDPFYSPGSDYIAMSNTFITNIILNDYRGNDVTQMTRKTDRLYLKLFESTLSLYQDQYQLFGTPSVMLVKYLWDTTLYWGLNCLLFIQDKFDDHKQLQRYYVQASDLSLLNENIQVLLREWGTKPQREIVPGYINISSGKFDFFIDMNRALTRNMNEEEFEREFSLNMRKLRSLYIDITGYITRAHPQLKGLTLPTNVDEKIQTPIELILKIAHGDVPMNEQYRSEATVEDHAVLEPA